MNNLLPARTKCRSRYFTVHITQSQGELTLPCNVSRNTREGERPWRLNVFDAGHTCLLLPHLTFDSPPETITEVEHHLRAQVILFPAYLGELHVTAA